MSLRYSQEKMMPSSEKVEARMVRHCTLCGSEGDILYPELSDRFYGVAGQWDLRQCRQADCGLLWLDPMPTNKGAVNIYQNYYTHGPKRIQTLRVKLMDFVKYLLSVDSMAKRAAKLQLPVKMPASVLDIGCGSGEFLAYLRNKGWAVTGTDIDAAAVKTAKDRYGLDIKKGELTEINLPGGIYDLIIMHHVVEHVQDPVGYMAESYRLLKPGGSLIVVTPNYASWASRYFSKEWFCLEPPRHLYMFSAKNLKKCANQAGFVESHIRTNNVESLVYIISSLDIKRTGKHLAGGERAVRDLIIGLIIKTIEAIQFLFDPDSGEELVLKAVKKQ